MKLRLVELSYEYKQQLFEMMDEWVPHNENHPNEDHAPWKIFKNDYHDFDEYLKEIYCKEEIKGFVPDSTYFCLDEERNIFVGAINFRHYLNLKLLQDGGHLGDGVRPSERKKGVASEMIRLCLEKCKDYGLKRVMITCSSSNIGSKKSIIKNGGILESFFKDDERYWIELDRYNFIEGENIVLRKARLDDLDNILNNIWSKEDVFKTMLFKPTTIKDEAIDRLVRTTNFQACNYGYFIAKKDTNEAIGFCGIKEIQEGVYEECGICVTSIYQGKGYGKETLALLLDLVFNKLNGKEFRYSLFKDNEKSRGLLRRYFFEFNKEYNIVRSWDNKEFISEEFILTKENYHKKF